MGSAEPETLAKLAPHRSLEAVAEFTVGIIAARETVVELTVRAVAEPETFVNLKKKGSKSLRIA